MNASMRLGLLMTVAIAVFGGCATESDLRTFVTFNQDSIQELFRKN